MIKETIVLEDGIEYIITDKINNYLYLSNINDPKDFCIRKELIEEGEEYISGLNNEEEYYSALKLFEEKYK